MTENPQKPTKSRLDLHDLDHHSIYSNHLNNSTAKVQYSLTKTPRWKESPQKKQEFKFYDLPSIQSNRSSSFAKGNQRESTIKNPVPPPNSYIILSQFQKRRKNAIAIGLGRQLVKNVTLFDQNSHKVPGPGSYQIKQSLSQQKVTMSGRLIDQTENWIRKVPGPGAYQTLELINKNLKSSNSKFQNPKGGKFGRTQQRSDFQRDIKKKGVPGAGKYSALQKQYQVASRFPRRKGQSFSRIERPSIANISIAPGPGAYNDYSEFIH